MHQKIDILLAVYNGEKFLAEQLESIINQSYKNWNLLIRDDNSKDDSLRIINKFQKRDQRITVIKDEIGNLGVNKNFQVLLNNSKAEYIAFADQDDYWLEEKIEMLYNKIKEIETKKTQPSLVHSDAFVADANLNIIANEFIGARALEKGLNKIIFSPFVQGASMLINKSLKKEVIDYLGDFKLYDYYISLINEAIGKRAYINQPLMYYRQHQNNLIGASPHILVKLWQKIIGGYNSISNDQYQMLNIIFNDFYDLIKYENKKYLEAYFRIINSNNILEMFNLIRKYKFSYCYGSIPLMIKILIEKK
ncbi:glycosyltransferase family 2 protein [Halanaerobium hydrogeniformans]|uniref:Glycosyl transferase family 2 n=1 Tax=Halanaerobium hydrogeniformans TaxID=656519 RepID=E4RM09_HALHG|nr:glycosyltransferase family 2 protein [Halanaerobium hydrogeniformans]ADQ14092.1 glycosyl transferase family 2 [Halanaerobium hydrogeniformans]